MGTYIKLNGLSIIGHVNELHPSVNPDDYDVLVDESVLVNSDGDYKYKFVDGQLVVMSNEEVNAHPYKVKKDVIAKADPIYKREEKKDKANKWKEVKKDPSFSVEEQAVIQEIIDELEG